MVQFGPPKVPESYQLLRLSATRNPNLFGHSKRRRGGCVRCLDASHQPESNVGTCRSLWDHVSMAEVLGIDPGACLSALLERRFGVFPLGVA